MSEIGLPGHPHRVGDTHILTDSPTHPQTVNY